MSAATTDTLAETNDHAEEATTILGSIRPSHVGNNPAAMAAMAQAHALLAIAQELAALRRAFTTSMDDAFAPRPRYPNEGPGGAVIEALCEIRGVVAS